jgi:hypothetical protein
VDEYPYANADKVYSTTHKQERDREKQRDRERKGVKGSWMNFCTPTLANSEQVYSVHKVIDYTYSEQAYSIHRKGGKKEKRV